MKFGHEYREDLVHEGFPEDWVNAAISYKRLKKCIKRVQQELHAKHLDPEKLRGLIRKHELEYEFEKASASPSSPSKTPRFVPKLLFKVNKTTGQVMDASISPDTLAKLHEMSLNDRLAQLDLGEAALPLEATESSSGSSSLPESNTSPGDQSETPSGQHRMVEVPLTSDSEFFNILQRECSSLTKIRDKEEVKLHGEIIDLGKTVSRVTKPSHWLRKDDIAKWRTIFELYLESQIFFATHEREHGALNSEEARKKLLRFADEVQRRGLTSTFNKKESLTAFQQFMNVNHDLLLAMRFQELNKLAMTKILKKFDKNTALSVQSTFPLRLPDSAFRESIAKAVCYEMNTELFPVVPQLDDYSCPICMDITWEPVRLRCGHIFCHRCLITMQTDYKDHCAICREKTVMEATTDQIDPSLKAFLKAYFPEQVKAKRKANEKLAEKEAFDRAFRSFQPSGYSGP